jgi:hypothetical protein
MHIFYNNFFNVNLLFSFVNGSLVACFATFSVVTKFWCCTNARIVLCILCSSVPCIYVVLLFVWFSFALLFCLYSVHGTCSCWFSTSEINNLIIYIIITVCRNYSAHELIIQFIYLFSSSGIIVGQKTELKLIKLLIPWNEVRPVTSNPLPRFRAVEDLTCSTHRRCPTVMVDIKCKSCSCDRPWRPIGLWDVGAPTFSRQPAHRWRWGQPYTPAAHYPEEDFWYSFLLEAESTPGP